MMESLKRLNVEELGGLQGYCLGIADEFAGRRPALAAFWRELAAVTRQALQEETLRVIQAQRELHGEEHREVEKFAVVSRDELIASYLRRMGWKDQSQECTPRDEENEDEECG